MKAICLELMRHTEHREQPIVMNFLISSANELAYMLAMKLLDVGMGWATPLGGGYVVEMLFF